MAQEITSKHLLEAILDPESRNTNFFNGRILTADDLKTDQNANRRQHEQLGRALGTGVVTGLEVSLVDAGSQDDRPPVLAVTQGLALTPAGQAVALAIDVQIALARQITAPVVQAGLFAECRPPKTMVTPPTDRGIYLLIMAPTSGYREQAPVHGFGDIGQVSGCGSRYAVEGVQFRLEELDVSGLSQVSATTRGALADLIAKSDPASLSKLRNWLAHLCFGTEEVGGFGRDPLTQGGVRTGYYGAIDALRSSGSLTDCDVPLAILFWPPSGVKFVDGWAVRRRLEPPRPSDWPLLVGERRVAEAEAVFLQFQRQLDELLGLGLSQFQLQNLKASDYFRYLPSAGVLPLARGAFRGFDPARFFGEQPHRDPEFMDGAVLRAALRVAFDHEPIDLAQGELLWLYRPWQNARAIDLGDIVAPYIVFTSGHLPHLAHARFDLSRWDYSNYASNLPD